MTCSFYLLLSYKNTLEDPLKNCAVSPMYGVVVVAEIKYANILTLQLQLGGIPTPKHIDLKGQCNEIFCFWFFS